MSIALEKLDNRHMLHQYFTHRVQYIGDDDAIKFIDARNWLWENYGPGLERAIWYLTKYTDTGQPSWAWHCNDRHYYLYLKDALVTHFSLKYLNN